LLENLAERRDAQGDQKKPQHPVAGGVLDEFDRIRRQAAFKAAQEEQRGGNQAQNENRPLGPGVEEDFLPHLYCSKPSLVILAQIHAGVKAGHLIAVAVELDGLHLEQLADTALAALAPSRVISFRVDV